jgi:hypothetical protein
MEGARARTGPEDTAPIAPGWRPDIGGAGCFEQFASDVGQSARRLARTDPEGRGGGAGVTRCDFPRHD